MQTRHLWICGIAVGCLAMVLPAQADRGLPAGAFVIAKRGADDGTDRLQESRRDGRKATRRRGASESEGESQRNYGYGYERRQRDPAADETAAEPRRRGGAGREEAQGKTREEAHGKARNEGSDDRRRPGRRN